MLLQNDDAEFGSRLKRVILLGDHHQLPPVIKNRAFQKYSHMDQSLFTRFVRLGMPYIQLNGQGRCRASLASLWNWRYQNLINLPSVSNEGRFLAANAGLAFDFQLVNVDDYLGQGESCPSPHFYQNLGEAEYIVQMYMYMRLMGYPADKISIITTYNGQKALIKDVIAQRCATNPLFGSPARISTVDKFQGQQNDCKLLHLLSFALRHRHLQIMFTDLNRYLIIISTNQDSWSYS
jgi:intron-binding protein aquarius